MLQQTQVDRVIPKYDDWLSAFPTVRSLARARLAAVLRRWSGLGYNSRAKRLRDLARAVVRTDGGTIPTTVDALEQLPGVGPYTARAVASFSHRADVAVIDTNVRRVVSRLFFGLRSPSRIQLDDTVTVLLPRGRSADWNAALMDFGAAVCTSRNPKCATCPLQSVCRAYPSVLKQSRRTLARPSTRFQDSDRYWRGVIIRTFLQTPRWTRSTLIRHVQLEGNIMTARLRRILRVLEHEQILTRKANQLRLAA